MQFEERIPEFLKKISLAANNPSNIDAVKAADDILEYVDRLLRDSRASPPRQPFHAFAVRDTVVYLISRLDSRSIATTYSAIWCLTNITTGKPSMGQVMYEGGGAIGKIIRLLLSPDARIRAQAAWILGNLIREGGVSARDRVLNCKDTEAIPALLKCINGELDKPSGFADVLENSGWLLEQLCRSKPAPSIQKMECVIPTLKRLLSHPAPEICDRACWAISNITDGPPERIDIVAKYDVFDTIKELLRSQRRDVILPAMRCFGNFTLQLETNRIMVEKGVLDLLLPTLHRSMPRDVRKEAIWMISNTIVGCVRACQAVRKAGLLPLVVQNLAAAEMEVRRESVIVIANSLCSEDPTLAAYMIEHLQIAAAVAPLLAETDSMMLDKTLKSFEVILKAGEDLKSMNQDRVNPYAVRLEIDGYTKNYQRDDKLERVHQCSGF